MSAPLNLARRPLRNERLPTVLLAAACVLLGATTVRHVVVAYELRPGGARDLEGEVVKIEQDLGRLRAESSALRRTSAPDSKVQEWAAVAELVARRSFSWTGLFAALEDVLPPGVRLTSVAPTTDAGPMLVSLSAVGRSPEDAFGLFKALRASPRFEGAFLDAIAETADGVQVTLTVRYLGAGRPAGQVRR